jgi:predicted  nucleic acid-binding Zn-ribbon protein
MSAFLNLDVGNDDTLKNIFSNNPQYIDISGSVNICLVRCGQTIDQCNEVQLSSMTNYGKILVINPTPNNKIKCAIKLAFDTSIGDSNYTFEKIIFSIPTMHRLNGQIYDMESILVFSSKKDDNKLYTCLCSLYSGVDNVQSSDPKLLTFKLLTELFSTSNPIPKQFETSPISGKPNPIDISNFIPPSGMRSFYDYTHPSNTKVNFRIFQNILNVPNSVLSALKLQIIPKGFDDFKDSISKSSNPTDGLFIYYSEDLTDRYKSLSVNSTKSETQNKDDKCEKDNNSDKVVKKISDIISENENENENKSEKYTETKNIVKKIDNIDSNKNKINNSSTNSTENDDFQEKSDKIIDNFDDKVPTNINPTVLLIVQGFLMLFFSAIFYIYILIENRKNKDTLTELELEKYQYLLSDTEKISKTTQYLIKNFYIFNLSFIVYLILTIILLIIVFLNIKNIMNSNTTIGCLVAFSSLFIIIAFYNFIWYVIYKKNIMSDNPVTELTENYSQVESYLYKNINFVYDFWNIIRGKLDKIFVKDNTFISKLPDNFSGGANIIPGASIQNIFEESSKEEECFCDPTTLNIFNIFFKCKSDNSFDPTWFSIFLAFAIIIIFILGALLTFDVIPFNYTSSVGTNNGIKFSISFLIYIISFFGISTIIMAINTDFTSLSFIIGICISIIGTLLLIFAGTFSEIKTTSTILYAVGISLFFLGIPLSFALKYIPNSSPIDEPTNDESFILRLQAELEESEREKILLTTRISELISEAGGTEGTEENKRRQIEGHQSNINRLQQQINELSSRPGIIDENKRRQITDLESAIAILRKKISKLGKIPGGTGGTDQNKNSVIEDLRRQLDELKRMSSSNKPETNSQLLAKQQEINSLRQQLSHFDGIYNEKGNTSETESELLTKQHEINNLRHKLSFLEGNIRNKSDTINQLQNNVSKSKDEIESKKHEIERYKEFYQGSFNNEDNEISKLREEIVHLSSLLNNKESELTLLKSNNPNKKQQIIQLTKELNNMKKLINNKSKTINNLHNNISSLSNALMSKDNLLTLLRDNYIRNSLNIIPILKRIGFITAIKPFECIANSLNQIFYKINSTTNINTKGIEEKLGDLNIGPTLESILSDTSINNKKSEYLNKINEIKVALEDIIKKWSTFLNNNEE